jgi:superfamily I DNA/RNA helicase
MAGCYNEMFRYITVDTYIDTSPATNVALESIEEYSLAQCAILALK